MAEVGEIFAERVRLRLAELEWTHAKLAERLKISAPTVSQTLLDGRAPRIDTLLRWADALGVRVEWLLGRDEVAYPAPKPTPEEMATKRLAKRSSHIQTVRSTIKAEEFVEYKPRFNLTPAFMIREIRELQGLTQAELSEISGISQAAISALENGTQSLGIYRAKVLATALKVHPAVLAFPGWGDGKEIA